MRHAYDVGDSGQRRDDTVRNVSAGSQKSKAQYTPAERIGVFFTELFEKDDTELGKQRIFPALLDDDSELASKIRSLLTDFRALIVQSPKNGRYDLRQIRLDPCAYQNESVSKRESAW